MRSLYILDSKYQKDESLLIFFYSVGHLFITVVFVFFAVPKVLEWCNPVSRFLLLALGQWKYYSESYCLSWKVSHVFLLQFQRFWSYFKVFVKNLWCFLFKQSIWGTWTWTQMPLLHTTLSSHGPIMYTSVMFSPSLRRLWNVPIVYLSVSHTVMNEEWKHEKIKLSLILVWHFF